MREAIEAGELPPLVEPDDAPTRPRSSITPPVPLPDAPTASAAPALPPEAAGATSVPVERPSAGESAPQATDSESSDAAASASSASAPAAPALGTWGRRGRRSAVSARSVQSVASAPASSASEPIVLPAADLDRASVPSVPLAEPRNVSAPSVSSAPDVASAPRVASAPIVSSTPISSSPRPEPSNTSPAAPIVTSTPLTRSTDASDDAPGAEERASRYAEFDSLLAPDGGGSTISTNALVLPSVPGHEDLPRALDGTGEIIVTGTFALPNSLAETGAHHPVLDGTDVDRLLDSDEPQPVAPGSGPVRASRAVSTHTATRGIIQPKRPKSNRMLTALAITASGLAVGVVGLLVVGVMNGVFF